MTEPASEKSQEQDARPAFQQRDAETYIAIGLYITAVGIPVIVGTIWAMAHPKAAIVNAVCGIVLTLIGLGCCGYGWILLKRKRA